MKIHCRGYIKDPKDPKNTTKTKFDLDGEIFVSDYVDNTNIYIKMGESFICVEFTYKMLKDFAQELTTKLDTVPAYVKRLRKVRD